MSLPFDLQVVALLAVSWAVTYAVHSTILLCGAWLLERRLGDRPELMSPIWKVAVLGGAFSATLQLVAGLEPAGGRWAIAAEERAAEPLRMTAVAPAVMGRVVVAPALASVAEAPLDFALASSTSAPLPEPVLARAARERASVATTAAPPSWTAPARAAIALLMLWIVGGLVAILGLVRSWLALRRILRGRLALRAGALADTFARLQASAGGPRSVRLSVSPTIRVPLATGVVRPEIVVPRRALRELGAAAQQSMLAHELGHVVRRDPAWRLFVAVVERVLFFQPLLRIASRRIAQHAEYLADAWAARHTAQPLALARCLTEIATWLRAGPVPAGVSLASGMAEPASILGRRVLRLVEPAAPPKRRGGAVFVIAALAVLALAWIAPVASWAHDESHVVEGMTLVDDDDDDDDDDDEPPMVVIDGGRARGAELDALQHR
ncbi:MAG TPA: M56 family metallopeptidase, partial [Nannocystaceae bacterium]|nr:M56 family metallopeptidase [Nannocystaceae bacterium]